MKDYRKKPQRFRRDEKRHRKVRYNRGERKQRRMEERGTLGRIMDKRERQKREERPVGNESVGEKECDA